MIVRLVGEAVEPEMLDTVDGAEYMQGGSVVVEQLVSFCRRRLIRQAGDRVVVEVTGLHHEPERASGERHAALGYWRNHGRSERQAQLIRLDGGVPQRLHHLLLVHRIPSLPLS